MIYRHLFVAPNICWIQFLPTNLQFQHRYNSELCKEITQLSMRPKCRGLV